jgi:hypothetical protein
MTGKNECAGLMAAIVMLAGCTKTNPAVGSAAATGKSFAIAVESAAFYFYGPQQGSGPDKNLEKGAIVTLVRPSFGYCKVKLAGGEVGFVASDDIGPAPAPITPARNEHFRFNPSDRHPGGPPDSSPEFEPTPIPGPPVPPNL